MIRAAERASLEEAEALSLAQSREDAVARLAAAKQ
jgi:hypothetical protein